MTTSPVEFPQVGGCGCEQVRYQLTSDPLSVYACHCIDCQTMTGASFFLSMIVRRESIVLLKGEPHPREYSLPDGRQRAAYVCTECLVSLWTEHPGFPDLYTLRAGTLDEASWVRPVAHLFIRSVQPWIAIPPGDLRYEGNPDDLAALFEAWKSRVRTSSGATQRSGPADSA